MEIEANGSTPQRTAGTGGRVLVVDDEEMVRRLVRSMLIRLGYEVVLAEDGARAVEIYREDPHGFEVVVLDMIMPRMNGQQCFMNLKAINPGVKAVLSSGFIRDGAAQEILEQGVKTFVQKPYRLQELSNAIDQAKAG